MHIFLQERYTFLQKIKISAEGEGSLAVYSFWRLCKKLYAVKPSAGSKIFDFWVATLKFAQYV